MDDHSSPSPPPTAKPLETWVAVALRRHDGKFLAHGSGFSIFATASPFQVEAWPNADELHVWLAARPPHFRRLVRLDGYEPVEFRLAVRLLDSPAPEARERRPIVAEAVCEVADA